MSKYYTNQAYREDESYNAKGWKLKRKEILLRDSFECQMCQNSRLINKSKVGKIVNINKYRSFLAMGNKTDELFYKYAYKIEYEDDRNEPYEQNVLSHIKTEDFDSFKDEDIHLCTIRSNAQGGGFFKDSINLKVTDTIINCIVNQDYKNVNDKWFFVRNLHVHHINYPVDDDISNVPNEYLETLCARCHQEKHPHRDLAGYCD